MMAVGLTMMVAALGAAIDLSRLYIAQSQMQAGVDAAALAGANAFDNADAADAGGRRQQVIAYYRDNYPDDYMDVQAPDDGTPVAPTRTLMEPSFRLVRGISQTEVRAAGRLPMTFMSLFGLGPQPIGATAHAEFQPHPLEVMVVLDNTGSMDGNIGSTTTKKITALKTAMYGFINVLYQGGSANQPNLALGIINYTNQVNVGSLLAKAAVPVETIPGFTDKVWPVDPMGWKGCVANDDSVTNMSADAAVVEPEAYDVSNVLPGEKAASLSVGTMRPIRPLLMPPLWLPKSTGASQTTATAYYTPDATNNLYSGSGMLADEATVSLLANSASFKRYFYRYYIKLNNGAATMDDDVIVGADGTSYYDPTATGAFNPLANSGTDFWVRAGKLPNLSGFKAVTTYKHVSNNTAMPSPNWQCPEPGLPIDYGVPRKTYDDFIKNDVWAILPANGTMHHTGLLWGWRILSRHTVFTRTPPVGSAPPTRALVFMTDGETALGGTNNANDKVYTSAYGSIEDKTITTGVTADRIAAAADLRYAKTCARMNNYVFPDSGKSVQTYVVAINTDKGLTNAQQNLLKTCGKDGWYLTASPTDLNNAFALIARALVDVHLTR